MHTTHDPKLYTGQVIFVDVLCNLHSSAHAHTGHIGQ